MESHVAPHGWVDVAIMEWPVEVGAMMRRHARIARMSRWLELNRIQYEEYASSVIESVSEVLKVAKQPDVDVHANVEILSIAIAITIADGDAHDKTGDADSMGPNPDCACTPPYFICRNAMIFVRVWNKVRPLSFRWRGQ